jgi:hypothetical protein
MQVLYADMAFGDFVGGDDKYVGDRSNTTDNQGNANRNACKLSSVSILSEIILSLVFTICVSTGAASTKEGNASV